MDYEFRLFPRQASTFADRVDTLYLFLVTVSTIATLLICFLIIYFGVKYRRGSKAHRENPPASYLLELTWAAIPFGFVMIAFSWGAVLYFEMQSPPSDATEIYVVGKQWMWKTQHQEGRREINQLHVPAGRPIRLRMISEDVIHSFYVPDFRTKMDVLPGRYTSLWFQATRPGTYHLFCAEYCGTAHSEMIGRVVVMEPREFAEWLTGETREPMEVAGRNLFERYRCDTCHPPGPGRRGPSLVGLYGRNVPLEDGRVVVADEDYIRQSILNPQAHIVAGFQPIMPSYEGQLSEEEIFQLIAFIRSLENDRDLQPSGVEE